MSRRLSSRVFLTTIAAAAACAATVVLLPDSPSTGDPGEVVWTQPLDVVRVVDGDTLIVATPTGDERVRMIGIDTPETVRQNTPVECFGPEASAHTHQLLDGQQVRLAADSSQDDRDRYGRLLRYVQTLTGVDVGADLLTGGFAREYTFQHHTYDQQASFRALEQDAQQDGRGLWSSC